MPQTCIRRVGRTGVPETARVIWSDSRQYRNFFRRRSVSSV